MTIPDPNYDRREVQITEAPGVAVEQQVVENRSAANYQSVSRVSQVIWTLFGILIGMMLLRVLLRLIGANPESGFASLIYGVTDIFLWPFLGITATPSLGAFAFDLPALIGVLVYLLIAWVVVRLVWLMFYHPSTTSVSTVRRDRL